MPVSPPDAAAPTPFRPSTQGLPFSNAWPDEPAVTLPTPFGTIPVGNAAAGLRGGMVFAALDYWHAGAPVPALRPGPTDPLFGYIVRRLVDSWNVPAGVAQYYQWMNLPDADRVFSVLGHQVVTEHGVVWRTTQSQWPQVQGDLDAGVPVPLGIVTVSSASPQDLGLNHQVAAWSYSRVGSTVTLLVYDPNRPGADDAGITFEATAGTSAGPTAGTSFTHTLGLDHPVRGFFRTAYAPQPPPTGPG